MKTWVPSGCISGWMHGRKHSSFDRFGSLQCGNRLDPYSLHTIVIRTRCIQQYSSKGHNKILVSMGHIQDKKVVHVRLQSSWPVITDSKTINRCRCLSRNPFRHPRHLDPSQDHRQSQTCTKKKNKSIDGRHAYRQDSPSQAVS